MCQKSQRDRLLQDADDMLFAMRMLADSGDVKQSATIVEDAIRLTSDAAQYSKDHDDAFVEGYVRERMIGVAHNLRGIPIGSNSVFAEDARKYRMRAGSDVYYSSRDRDVFA